MLTKSFEELLEYPIPDEYLQTRDGITYLPWANCKALLHKLGAEKVFFEPLVDPATNSSLFMSDKEFKDSKGNVNRVYEVAVHVTIDDLVFDIRTPVMNGANPVKDNSMSQQRVWASQCRAFVKGVAIYTGLGFKLWLKGDVESDFGDDVSLQDIMKYCEKLQRLYSDALYNTKYTTKQLADAIGYAEDDVGVFFKYCRDLAQFEEKLKQVNRGA